MAFVAYGRDVIASRMDSQGMVVVATAIRATDSIHTLYQGGVRSDQIVWSDSCGSAWAGQLRSPAVCEARREEPHTILIIHSFEIQLHLPRAGCTEEP
jgi:hypothetical protein